MIIGERREDVIENIRQATERKEMNCKVEIGDPILTQSQSQRIIKRYLTSRRKISYKFKAMIARWIANIATDRLNYNTKIEGWQKIASLTGGALITCNHFNQLDNTVIRYLTLNLGKKRINIISQETNFAMNGIIGYLMKYADTIPLSNNLKAGYKGLMDVMAKLLNKGEYILIYPEQEMWFNYRKPRPCMKGAYLFATKLKVPIISCFIEIRDMDEMDTDEFRKVKYVIHILDVIRPEQCKSDRDNMKEMCERDYELKKSAYERIYGKELSYDFEPSDIAGWLGE